MVKPEEGTRSAFQQAGITCPGDRPWLGDGASEPCTEPLVGALINQTNLYFPRTISAIYVPDIEEADDELAEVRNEIEKDAVCSAMALTLWRAGSRPTAVAMVRAKLLERNVNRGQALVERALESLLDSSPALGGGRSHPAEPESELLSFRRAEFGVIRTEVNDARLSPHLTVIPSEVPGDLTQWLSLVNLVERLRETRVFYGFDRLEVNARPLEEMPDSAMSQLFRNPPSGQHDRWLPAVEIFGEGIYLELNEDHIKEWQSKQAEWLQKRLSDSFVTRLAAVFQTLPPLGEATWVWASKYLLIHSLAHILINQFVFDCGYSTASLRERLYVSTDADAPMAGILIYTAAGDSEGTLGGLVSLGRKDRLSAVIRGALSRAAWCSADPVCSMNSGGQGAKLANLAACHACTLLPETSCETINNGLDRAMIVGTPEDREPGFMRELIENAYSLE
jgi:hypothetical protein